MIAIVIGTRPEIIKMSPLIRECQKRKLGLFILHTGQHYSYEMDQQFFSDLNIAQPKYNLGVGGQPYRKQVGMMIRQITGVLSGDRPEIVFVQGDTNSVLAAALAANKLRIPVGHHEAGLRSHDLTMLEETNRIITDHISDFLFTPTKDAMANLKDEGIDAEKVHYTGNTVVDACMQNLQIARKKTSPLARLGLQKKKYAVATAHRAENVDNEKRLRGILEGLSLVAANLEMPVIYPIHPRTVNNMKRLKIGAPKGVRLTEPLGYLDFLCLTESSAIILTDSGGLQEEACILEVPCVTLRENTERPETIDAGLNMLAGTNPGQILACARRMMGQKIQWTNPFGDGKAAERIIDAWQKSNS